MESVIGIVVSLVVGAGAVYAVLRSRSVRLETQLDERTRQLATAIQERDDERNKREYLSDKLSDAQAELSGYQSSHKEREKAIEERREELDTHFKGLASEVLKSNTEEFRKQAAEQFKHQQELAGKDLTARQTAVENLVNPVRESLDELRKYVDDSDKARIADTTKISQSVDGLMAETSGLRKILHNPQLRGQWGEQHLHNVLEAAGMTPHVDYVEQETVSGAPDAARLRPDVLVRIPNRATVVIDAKTPHVHYDRALDSTNEQEQTRLLAEHAAALASHAKDLASRDYAQWIEGSPDFVMMYVPTDPMLDAAIKVNPSIWQETWQRHRVLITTPGLLIAFLRTVAMAWRQQKIQQNAEKIAKTGRGLYDRLRKYTEHLDRMGRGLKQAVDAYNSGVGSFQSRLLVQAQLFEKLGATGDTERIGEPKQIGKAVSQVDVLEQPPPSGSSEKEELDDADDKEDAPEPPLPADSSD